MEYIRKSEAKMIYKSTPRRNDLPTELNPVACIPLV